MYFEEDKVYHIYNRGNNRQKIFFRPNNYSYFLNKVRKYISPNCEILAYCLMPNHFHFMVQATELTGQLIKRKGGIELSKLSEGIRMLLSSYTQAINKQEGRTGSLFTQNTKSKALNNSRGKYDYAFTCFNYIHQNPIKAGLVDKMEDWKYSSFLEYQNAVTNGLCNTKIIEEIINFDNEAFYEQSYLAIEENRLNSIW